MKKYTQYTQYAKICETNIYRSHYFSCFHNNMNLNKYPQSIFRPVNSLPKDITNNTVPKY